MLSALFGMEDYFEDHCGAHTAHSTDAPLARKGKRERGTVSKGASCVAYGSNSVFVKYSVMSCTCGGYTNQSNKMIPTSRIVSY